MILYTHFSESSGIQEFVPSFMVIVYICENLPATYRAHKLPVVNVVVLYVECDALCTERMQAGQGLGGLEAIQADLALQELVPDVLLQVVLIS
jgi:hypothetical protein